MKTASRADAPGGGVSDGGLRAIRAVHAQVGPAELGMEVPATATMKEALAEQDEAGPAWAIGSTTPRGSRAADAAAVELVARAAADWSVWCPDALRAEQVHQAAARALRLAERLRRPGLLALAENDGPVAALAVPGVNDEDDGQELAESEPAVQPEEARDGEAA